MASSPFTPHPAARLETKTVVVAEMACAHEGQPERARKLISAAANAKVDAIQFQLFSAQKLVSPRLPTYELTRRLEIPESDWRFLFSEAGASGLRVWANVFDDAAITLAVDAGAQVLKVHATDLSNPRLLDAVSETKLPVSLATGGSSLDEIQAAIEHLTRGGTEELLLMHGFQAYPTEPEHAELRFIATLKRLFGCPVGYQDHTDGGSVLATILPLVAVGLGADVLEKHVTDERERRGIDYESAFDPEQLSVFVQTLRSVEGALGTGTLRAPSAAERSYRERSKRSIVAACDIQQGEVLSERHLEFLRSTPGLAPSEMHRLLGRRTRRLIRAHENLSLADVSE